MFKCMENALNYKCFKFIKKCYQMNAQLLKVRNYLQDTTSHLNLRS